MKNLHYMKRRENTDYRCTEYTYSSVSSEQSDAYEFSQLEAASGSQYVTALDEVFLLWNVSNHFLNPFTFLTSQIYYANGFIIQAWVV